MSNNESLITDDQETVNTSRRRFVKKAAYTAPALVVLGVSTPKANADFGSPPPAPGAHPNSGKPQPQNVRPTNPRKPSGS